jgi:putative polyketide hydroxylase
MSDDRRPAGEQVPVLVVGAGPAGLTTAITLARYGVRSLLVERRTELSGLPRAASMSTRTMELFRSWGLERDVRTGGVEVEWSQWVGRTLRDAGETRPTSFPTREQSIVLSPTAPASVPQDHLEPVLLEHLRSLRPAQVDLGTELVELDSGAAGSRAILRDVRTGRRREVHARFVVAADGAGGRAREALGIAMTGPGGLSSAIGTLFHAPLWELVGERRFCIYAITHPAAAGVFVPAGRADRWTYGVEFATGAAPVAEFTVERVTALIRLAAGDPDLQPRVERIGAFTFAAGLAESFRRGSAFLVGDAAHRVTPRGGTGLNTAVRSAHDLGWKLAWVRRGWAGPGLLDSYEAERRPAAGHNVARSADPHGGARGVEEELHADLGGRIPHLWCRTAAGRVSSLDLLGPGLTLFTGPAGATWRAAAAALRVPVPVAVRVLDAHTARGMGLGDRGALLARPDAAPAGIFPCDFHAPAALTTAVQAVMVGTGSPRSDEPASDPRPAPALA